MEITELYIPNGLWMEDGKWYGVLEVNDSENTYEFSIKDGDLTFKIKYRNGPYNEKKASDVLELALQNQEVKTLLEKAKKFTTALDEITSLQKDSFFKLELQEYVAYNNWEIFDFIIKEYNLEIRYSMNGKEIYSCAEYPGEDRVRTYEVVRQFPSFINENIIKQLEKDPKVRLRKVFKR